MDRLEHPIDFGVYPEAIEDFGQIGPRFCELVMYAVGADAPNFAADLACYGADPLMLRVLAGSWREWDLEPCEFARWLEDFADDVMRIKAGLLHPDEEH